ncbi:MAG TPA: hypothetical protein VM513_18725 [Kofleriaceae bacterium]|jgi:hypothetical protein|nr:hypothetical protein [Kofleriaceae bacterium]
MIEAAPPLAELAVRLRASAAAIAPRRTTTRAADAVIRPAASPAFDEPDDAPLVADLVGTLAIACSDLADGFASPPESRRRLAAHRRAWIAIRDLDYAITAAARQRRVPADLVKRAQRAIDRADVLVAALLPG